MADRFGGSSALTLHSFLWMFAAFLRQGFTTLQQLSNELLSLLQPGTHWDLPVTTYPLYVESGSWDCFKLTSIRVVGRLDSSKTLALWSAIKNSRKHDRQSPSGKTSVCSSMPQTTAALTFWKTNFTTKWTHYFTAQGAPILDELQETWMHR